MVERPYVIGECSRAGDELMILKFILHEQFESWLAHLDSRDTTFGP
jgi:hypothetical protein